MYKSGWAALLLGIGLGGFIDGILFHQVLQWHHLLSALAPDRPLTWHIVWDGVFHLGIYAVLAVGVGLLWAARAQMAGQGWRFWGSLVMGLGLFHVADGVVFHWALGAHHINMEQPLLWGAIMFGLGVALTVAGIVIRMKEPRGVAAPGSM